MADRRLAPAKVNLTLHVTGRRADGYHLLDSLVVFAGAGDWLSAVPAREWGLSVTGPRAAGVPVDASNLVLRAARATGAAPRHFTLDKHLPAEAGIGGGSADAAAAIALCGALPSDPAALGADVPVCLAGPGPVRMRGVGERVERLPDLPPAWLVLVNPGTPVPTPEVFRRLRAKDNAPMPATLPRFGDAAALGAWLSTQRNDLLAPALEIAPLLGDVLERLREVPGVLAAGMSGSGATCFGVFGSGEAAERAARALARPGWWSVAAPVLRGMEDRPG